MSLADSKILSNRSSRLKLVIYRPHGDIWFRNTVKNILKRQFLPTKYRPLFDYFLEAPDVALSLSHTGHDACACIAAGDDVGIDLQKVEQRVGAFYRTNYAAAEHWISPITIAKPPCWLWK